VTLETPMTLELAMDRLREARKEPYAALDALQAKRAKVGGVWSPAHPILLAAYGAAKPALGEAFGKALRAQEGG
jgi:hypothetical protein